MQRLITKVIYYILISYVVYFCLLFLVVKDAKFVRPSDLRNTQDYLLFVWLFGVPVLIDFVLIGLPIYYGLKRIDYSNRRYLFSLFFILLLVVECLISTYIYGYPSGIIKTGVYAILFLIFFWKRLF